MSGSKWRMCTLQTSSSVTSSQPRPAGEPQAAAVTAPALSSSKFWVLKRSLTVKIEPFAYHSIYSPCNTATLLSASHLSPQSQMFFNSLTLQLHSDLPLISSLFGLSRISACLSGNLCQCVNRSLTV